MTRRIALAILVVACLMLMAGLSAAWVAVRQTMLAELDGSILTRATALLQQHHGPGNPVQVSLPPGDRYLIKTESGQTLGRPEFSGETAGDAGRLVVLDRRFVRIGNGKRVRTLSIRYVAGLPAEPVTVVYSAPATGFDTVLHHLAWVLVLVGSGGGMVTALVAIRVSRAALRPLQETAEIIGSIDQHKLDRRIEREQLPPEMHPVADRLNDMLARLEQSFARQKQFISDAAHELRTPLAALRTTLEVALRQNGDDPARQRRALENSLSSSRTLSRLAEVLLEQAKTDGAGRLEPAEDVDVAATVKECCDTIEPLAASKGVRLEHDCPAGLVHRGSSAALSSVLVNLLSNAVEHTGAGGQVSVSCATGADGTVVRVRDTGVGIDPDHLPHIFNPFYRADPSRHAAEGHLGLGLFITRSHVERWGGTIAARSEPGRGSEFVFTLPNRPTSSSPPRQQPERAAARPEPARNFTDSR